MAEIKHIDAFEYYYAQGPARNLDNVAQEFNKSIKTVKVWSAKEKWQEEIKYRDIEILKENRRQSLIGRRSKASDYKKLVDGSLKVYLEELKKGRIKVETVKDLDTLVKLACYLDDFVIDGEDRLIGETVQDQSAGDANRTTDTEETKSVLQQVKDSMAALEGGVDND